jgi:hypothetical protein
MKSNIPMVSISITLQSFFNDLNLREGCPHSGVSIFEFGRLAYPANREFTKLFWFFDNLRITGEGIKKFYF